MYYYKPDTNRQGKRAGAIAAVAYVALLAVLFVFCRTESEAVTASDGILIDFGADVDGAGEREPVLSEPETSTAAADNSPEDVLTQDFEPAPAVVATTQSREQALREEPVIAREVNPRALFPGRSASSQATSQGADGSAGNRGHEAGGDGAIDGTGIGTQGVSFLLEGRQPVDDLPQPAYNSNEQGSVVVEITVDAAGVVRDASVRALGSTTQDGALREAARAAALRARFTPSDEPRQIGTITYVFRAN